MVKKADTSANDVILEKSQKFPICGHEYDMRRLSTADVFTFSKMLSKVLKNVGDVNITSPEVMGILFMTGLAEQDKDICSFYGSLLGHFDENGKFVSLTAEEFLGQDPAFLGEFLDLLPQQYDMKSFFEVVLKAVKSLGSLWQTR